ncbi:MAG: CotH kinase family protein [Bacteroidales bacterium]|nr:CotH kinase family protein [Bacteroidales bacterium]
MCKTSVKNISALLVIVMLTACIKFPKPIEVVPIINLSAEVLQLSDEAESKSFRITADADWTITGGNSICVVNPESGLKNQTVTVTVTVPTNESDARTFVLTIKAGSTTKNVTVTQSAKQYAATVPDIVVTSFGITPANNERIYSEIAFITKNGAAYEFNGNKEIRHYKTDLSALKASWKCNTIKVTVEATTQINGVTPNNFTNELTYRFYSKDNNYKEFKIKLINPAESYSGLPLLVLTTNDGSDIVDKDVWKPGRFKLDAQGNAGVTELTGVTEIRGRGNSTWNMPKKPYALKLDKKDEGAFMGMNPHKRWAVLANYEDKTGIRNRVTFEIGKQTKLAWTPDSRYVEVMLNGKMLGNYLLTEQIKIDPKRVNIQEINNTETNAEKITGGWLLEIDRYYDLGETRYFRPKISQLPVIVADPENANDVQMNYIKNYFDNVDKLLYPTLPDGIPYHELNAHLAGTPDSTQYHQYIDIVSFIDYWIVQEVVGNSDSRLPGSIYMHKDVNGKLCAGPLWDFDQTTFMGDEVWMIYNYLPTVYDYSTLNRRTIMYAQLFKDAKFKALAKKRWGELYNYLSVEVTKFMDKEHSLIEKSLALNWIEIGENENQGIWPIAEADRDNGGRNHDKNLLSANAVEKMKTQYLQRLAWLNLQINSW